MQLLFSGRFAKAVEEMEEEDGDDGVDGSGDGQMQIKPRFGLREEHAAGKHEDALMQAEKENGQRKARHRMFRIEARADG